MAVSYQEPRIVTHLVYGDSMAVLPEPLLVVDSDQRPFFDRKALDKLTWTDFRNGRVSPPPKGAEVTALYYVPTRTRFAGTVKW